MLACRNDVYIFITIRNREDTKVIVFVASCAIADFFYHVLSGATADIGMIISRIRIIHIKLQ
jgi:hypothetical protein